MPPPACLSDLLDAESDDEFDMMSDDNGLPQPPPEEASPPEELARRPPPLQVNPEKKGTGASASIDSPRLGTPKREREAARPPMLDTMAGKEHVRRFQAANHALKVSPKSGYVEGADGVKETARFDQYGIAPFLVGESVYYDGGR